MKTEVSRVGDVVLYYDNGSFTATGIDGRFRSEHEILDYLEVTAAWDAAEEAKLMRIEFPYLQIWPCRFLRLKGQPGEWYSRGHSIYYNELTHAEEHSRYYPERRPEKAGRLSDCYLFSQNIWDKAKEIFSQMRAGYNWQRDTGATKPRENESWKDVESRAK